MCLGKGGTVGNVLLQDPKGSITEKLLSGVFMSALVTSLKLQLACCQTPVREGSQAKPPLYLSEMLWG